MSTGKRLAKRSIIGTRVCAPGDDGKFYSGVIHAVKTPGSVDIGHHSDTRYAIRFDPVSNIKSRVSREYRDSEIVGPGFRAVTGFSLQHGQKVYITYNGREICGDVTSHKPELDEVVVNIAPSGHDGPPMEIKKRLEEVRLLESRKSLRLMDQDTDFARLADMAGDRKRASSNSIDVPTVQGSRKRRPSSGESGNGKDLMDECTAALVLMSLSCSPHSPQLNGYSWSEGHPPSPTSDAWSRGSTPSPPLSDGGNSTTSSFWSQVATDEGIVCDQDFDDLPKKKKLHVDVGVSLGTRVVFQCTWPGCLAITTTCDAIEHHVRATHLGPRKSSEDSELSESDHEEEFYYTEVELGLHTSSPPTLSHRDMARPPHEDPEYLKQLRNSFSVGLQRAGPINIPGGHGMPWSSAATPSSLGSPGKHLKLSPRSGNLLSLSAPTSHKLPGSPTRKHRGDTKKCRKVYGMEHRELWCTQCKWKKACTRFGE